MTKIKIQSVIFFCSLTVPPSALAELTNNPLLGPGLRSRPAYPGSASQNIEIVPVIRYFGQPWFVRSTQGVLEGGVRMELVPSLHVGAQLAYESGRQADDSDFLKDHHLADIDRNASVGLHLEWDHFFGPMPITFLARTRQHIDSDIGAQADLRLSAGIYQHGRVAAGVFTQATWANAKSANAYYGITPQQSALSGLPTYNAGSGWIYASFGLLWSLDLSKDWVVVGSVESRQLHAAAERSPLAERASNTYTSLGVAYHF
ncbi:MAG: MipA/OmpV family protein [Gammaproteobacteria bacterium]|nr:MipA/OmpV family protein [Gammaproteobacteria bacterium]